jgi:flagellar hook-associated protein 1
MTGLSAALSQALSGLRVSSEQSALVSRNISRANEDGYSRKYAQVSTDTDGSARITSIARNSERKLLDAYNNASASNERQKIILSSLEALQKSIGDIEDESSLASGINSLQDKLKILEANPSDQNQARLAVRAAGSLATQLNSISQNVQQLRAEADAGVKASVDNINGLLARLQTVNNKTVATTTSDPGNAENLDERDSILKNLSAELGIRTVAQANNGIAVYTDGGVTLFNQVARPVTFAASTNLGASSAGSAVFADGVPIAGPGAQMPTKQGKLASHVYVRDSLTVDYHRQIDEIARGLVVAFSESDQSANPSLPDATGLFNYPGSPTVPSSPSAVSGLASAIRVNPAYEGNALLLRDAGSNGPLYGSNPSGTPGFQDRLSELISALDQQMTFSSDAKLPSPASIKDFAGSSAGWVENLRAEASNKSDYLDALAVRSREALGRATGVNIDDEMSAMLSLERSYQAAAKVMTVVGQMFDSLLSVVR